MSVASYSACSAVRIRLSLLENCTGAKGCGMKVVPLHQEVFEVITPVWLT